MGRGTPCPSIPVPGFLTGSSRISRPTSRPRSPYNTLRLYFGIHTIWYTQSRFVCARLGFCMIPLTSCLANRTIARPCRIGESCNQRPGKTSCRTTGRACGFLWLLSFALFPKASRPPVLTQPLPITPCPPTRYLTIYCPAIYPWVRQRGRPITPSPPADSPPANNPSMTFPSQSFTRMFSSTQRPPAVSCT